MNEPTLSRRCLLKIAAASFLLPVSPRRQVAENAPLATGEYITAHLDDSKLFGRVFFTGRCDGQQAVTNCASSIFRMAADQAQEGISRAFSNAEEVKLWLGPGTWSFKGIEMTDENGELIFCRDYTEGENSFHFDEGDTVSIRPVTVEFPFA